MTEQTRMFNRLSVSWNHDNGLSKGYYVSVVYYMSLSPSTLYSPPSMLFPLCSTHFILRFLIYSPPSIFFLYPPFPSTLPHPLPTLPNLRATLFFRTSPSTFLTSLASHYLPSSTRYPVFSVFLPHPFS